MLTLISEFGNAAAQAVQATSGAAASAVDTSDWVKWLFGIFIPIILGALYKVHENLASSIRDLRDQLQEATKESLAGTREDDQKLWDELAGIRSEIRQHDVNDATIHLSFANRLGEVASRADLHRELEVMTERIIGSRNPRRDA